MDTFLLSNRDAIYRAHRFVHSTGRHSGGALFLKTSSSIMINILYLCLAICVGLVIKDVVLGESKVHDFVQLYLVRHKRTHKTNKKVTFDIQPRTEEPRPEEPRAQEPRPEEPRAQEPRPEEPRTQLEANDEFQY